MSVEQEWLLIAGLGNPGREYAQNRHNVGFHCLDILAARHAMTFDKKQHQAELSIGRVAGQRVVLVKPQTFVNCSGEAVGGVARFYKVPSQKVLVIYDDLDLPQGVIRFRPSGSSGGHNGIKSIQDHLGTMDFPRLRVGIGRPPGRMDPADYVLQDFGPAEREQMQEVYDRAVAAVETFIRQGSRETMNQFNVRPRESEDAPEAG